MADKQPRYAMAMDTRRCVGCSACVISCKTENGVPLGCFRDWVVQESKGKFPKSHLEIRSERCNHCSNSPCVSACPTGASHFSKGGTVLVTHRKCTGCKACMAACPYDSRYVHPDGYVDKCTFCLHRVETGQLPACVTVCPTRALTFGDLSRPDSVISRLLETREHKVLHPETGCEPNLYFLL